MSRRKERRSVVDWSCEMLGANEENLSPLYSFYREEDFYRFEDASGKTGWIVGEYAETVQTCRRPNIPSMLVVYYDLDGLACLDPSRVFRV